MPNYTSYDFPNDEEDYDREVATGVIRQWQSVVRRNRRERSWNEYVNKERERIYRLHDQEKAEYVRLEREKQDRIRRDKRYEYLISTGLSHLRSFVAAYDKLPPGRNAGKT